MRVAKKVIIRDIDSARAKILDMFAEQCAHGRQTTDLPNTATAACGQFIGPEAKGLAQRGLHGTAAAIAVLAHAPPELAKAQGLVARLVKYAAERLSTDGITTPNADKDRIEKDSDNIIKVSEMLSALASVPVTTTPNAEGLRRQLTKTLRESRIEDKGWAYFRSDPSAVPQLLPTAYAVLALDAVGEDVTGPVYYLLEKLQQVDRGVNPVTETGADTTIRTVALYALVYRKHANQRSPIDSPVQQALFNGLWQRLEQLLRAESIEQNIEYWKGKKTFYVRVPWQLYLLALAAKVQFPLFATKSAQVRICEIVANLEEGKFRYPHSGNMISSRTNAIAFEVLGHIRNELDRSNSFSFHVWKDRIISWVGWRKIVFVLSGMFILYTIWCWATGTGQKQLSDLAPNLVAPLIVCFLTWGRGR